FQLCDTARIDVETQYRALFAELDCQRQANIAQTDYCKFHILNLQLESPSLHTKNEQAILRTNIICDDYRAQSTAITARPDAARKPGANTAINKPMKKPPG